MPGGVSGPLRLGAPEIFAAIDEIEAAVGADLRLLLATPSFVDRLRGTGVIAPAAALTFAALGPLGRASGQMEDVRFARPYAAYSQLGHQLLDTKDEGDALARQRVRNEEISGSFHLIRQAIDELVGSSTRPSGIDRSGSAAVRPSDGPKPPRARCSTWSRSKTAAWSGSSPARPRSTTWRFFHAAFPKDILTDFAFIEASFGLSIAGVAG